MTDAVFKGFDIASLRATAGAQPVGQQKAKFASDVAAQLGTNPTFEVRVGGVVVYRAAITGALSSSAAGIPLPTQFTEPPSINLSQALTDPTSMLVIKNSNNAAIEVQIPVKAGGGTGFVTASKGLDGVYYARTDGAMLLVPPAVLDVGGGGSGGGGGGGVSTAGAPTITRAQIIADMTTASVSQPRFGDTNNKQAAIQAANRRNVLRYEAIGPASTYKFSDYMDEILPWFWPYAGPGHNDSLNLRLQWDAGVISVKRASTGAWVDSPLRAGSSFDGYIWYGNSQQGTYLTSHGDYRDHPDGSRSSQFKGTLGAEVWIPKVLDRQLMLDCAEIAVACRARVIDDANNPYYGAGANYVSKMGFDLYGRSMPGPHQGGENRQPDGTWGKLANGSNSRFIGFTNGDWKTCAVITCGPSFNSQPGNARTGNYSVHPDAVLPPYVMTTAAINAGDHPSWVIA